MKNSTATTRCASFDTPFSFFTLTKKKEEEAEEEEGSHDFQSVANTSKRLSYNYSASIRSTGGNYAYPLAVNSN